MDVEDNAVVADIKREILPKLTTPDSYITYWGDKCVDIASPSLELDVASLSCDINPSVTERLVQKFGRSDPPQPPDCFEMSSAYLFWPALTYGEESQSQEVVQVFLSLMKEAKLDDGLSLKYQGVKEDSRIHLSIDIDFAVRCPKCKKPLDLCHVYHALGTDLAGFYTSLDAFCFQCGLKRAIGSLPPAVVAVHDMINCKSLVTGDRDIYLSVRASEWLQKEHQRRLRPTEDM
jgi:hypothetical protein